MSVGSAPSADTAVIEIGPAAGNLTRALLGRGHAKILLIEKDLRFKPILEVNISFMGKIKFITFSNSKITPMEKFNSNLEMHWSLMKHGFLALGQKMVILRQNYKLLEIYRLPLRHRLLLSLLKNFP